MNAKEDTGEKIIHWLKNKLKVANAAGFVVGLLGGVDSLDRILEGDTKGISRKKYLK